jgi:lysophospholipase L1-like esterase
MLGDSITAGWSQESWTNFWAPRGAFNFGIPADRTEHVLWRIKQGLFDKIDPEVVMLEVGTNDIKSGDIRRSPKEVFDAIRMIVEEIRAAEPKARIIVMAILPRQPEKYEWIDAVILETNARLSQLQRDIPNVLVVDTGIQYRGPNGKAARIHLQQDMLHLKKTGYDVWTQCVIDMVDAGLKGGQ